MSAGDRRALEGCQVVVTRAHGAAGGFVEQLEALGARVRCLPVIRSAPPTDPGPATRALRELGDYRWVVLTSPQGADVFFAQLAAMNPGATAARVGLRFAVVGTATARRVEAHGCPVAAMPAEFVGEHVAAAMAESEHLWGQRVLLARAQEANPALVRELQVRGALVDDVAFYRTVPETADPTGEAARLVAEGADWITFTSGSTVRNFAARLNLLDLQRLHPRLRLASIGPETSKVLRVCGAEPSVEAHPHTLEALVRALVEAGPVAAR